MRDDDKQVCERTRLNGSLKITQEINSRQINTQIFLWSSLLLFEMAINTYLTFLPVKFQFTAYTGACNYKQTTTTIKKKNREVQAPCFESMIHFFMGLSKKVSYLTHSKVKNLFYSLFSYQFPGLTPTPADSVELGPEICMFNKSPQV